MEGFKANPKMKSEIACFKEGGSVYKSRTHREDPAEAAEDKAMVKKGIGQHEAAKHKGEEKTDIKLKKGGRSKKDGGNVRKFKTGGVTNVKKAGGKADAPSAAVKKKKESPGTTNKGAKKTMTASSTGPVPAPTPAKSAALAMPENQPIEMMADGGMMTGLGRGAAASGMPVGLDRAAAMSGRTMPVVGQRATTMPIRSTGLEQASNVSGQQLPAMGGMGAAAPSAPMGNAAPLGAISDQERQILKGLQALGQYAEGGSTC